MFPSLRPKLAMGFPPSFPRRRQEVSHRRPGTHPEIQARQYLLSAQSSRDPPLLSGETGVGRPIVSGVTRSLSLLQTAGGVLGVRGSLQTVVPFQQEQVGNRARERRGRAGRALLEAVCLRLPSLPFPSSLAALIPGVLRPSHYRRTRSGG